MNVFFRTSSLDFHVCYTCPRSTSSGIFLGCVGAGSTRAAPTILAISSRNLAMHADVQLLLFFDVFLRCNSFANVECMLGILRLGCQRTVPPGGLPSMRLATHKFRQNLQDQSFDPRLCRMHFVGFLCSHLCFDGELSLTLVVLGR